MALLADHSQLPKAAPTQAAGLVPDATPRFVQLLVEAWRQDDLDHPYVPQSGARFWHSSAGKCARAIAYKAAGIPESDPMDLSGVNNVRIGSLLHDAWQQAAIKALGEKAEAEVRVRTLNGDGTGKIDLVVTDEKVTDIELKTIGGFGYKSAIGKARRGSPAEGPKSEHLLQAALNGYANDADEVVVAYLGKEAISVTTAGSLDEITRFACEWTFTREQFVPLAERELERVAGILHLVDEGVLAARKMIDLPSSAEIVDPASGRWEQHDAEGMILDTGTHWSCSYCSHRSICAQTPSGRVETEQVVAISTKASA